MSTAGRDAGRERAADRKALVQANMLRLCEHYAGAVVRSGRADGGARHHFYCPRCARQTFTAYLPADAEPPGSGTAGCSVEGCPVPPAMNAPDLVAFCEGYDGPSAFKRALARAEGIIESLEAAPTLISWVPQEPGLPDPTSPPASSPLPGPGPQVPSASSSSELPPPVPEQAKDDGRHAATQDPMEDPGKDHNGARPREPRAPQTDRAETVDHEAEIKRRDVVYRALLGMCPPDERLIAFFEKARIGGGLVRRAGFGISYAARSTEILAELVSRFGAVSLSSVSGFSPRHAGGSPKGSTGGARYDLASGDWALVPYTDGAGRIVALEAFDLTEGTSHLLGEGRRSDGRDSALGSANHIWYTGEPSRIEALTDNLLEAMRAEEAGVRCAAIRAPGAHYPPAGSCVMPELAGVSFRKRKVLYAPSATNRARAAAPAAASATIGAVGGRPIVVAPPYETAAGLGTYLLSFEAEERALAFDGLFHPAITTELDPQGGRERDGNTPGSQNDPKSVAAGQRRLPKFEAEARKGPRMPPKDLVLGEEAGRGVLAALLVAVPVWLLVRVSLLPLLGLVHDLAGEAEALASAPDAGLDLADPQGTMLGLLGKVLGPLTAPLVSLLGSADALLSTDGSALLVAAIVCSFVGLHITLRAGRWRFKRAKMMAGEIKRKRRRLKPRTVYRASKRALGGAASFVAARSRRAAVLIGRDFSKLRRRRHSSPHRPSRARAKRGPNPAAAQKGQKAARQKGTRV